MNLPCRWDILLISLWIQVGFVPGIHFADGTVSHLSREDVVLLKDEEDPKCFSRTQWDFTCFFETADNRTYDLFYSFLDISQPENKRCEMSVQRTEEETFLHICSFPDSDVFLYVQTYLEVVERSTNTSLYNRTVSVEDHYLLDPPFNTSLQQNDQVGQLQVSWHTKVLKYMDNDVTYRIRYASKGLGKKTKEEAEKGDILYSLVPGEEVEVQVSVKHDSDAGHWSSWSQPARAMVPQSADDISLMCYTSDLQTLTCQWNGSRYGVEKEFKLFYKMCLSIVRDPYSEALDWTEWTECLADRKLTDLCRFHGSRNESRKVRVKLSSTPAPLSRTFYSQEFTLDKKIKTSPPSNLRGSLEKDKLCLKWEAPLLSLSTPLQYEVSYQTKGGEACMTVSLKGPETTTCLQIPSGSHYSVKVRAKPKPIDSGYWSDWSDVLTGDTPTDIGTLLMLCIPVLMLITAIILIFLFYTQLSKLKQYFWPPVPNLKVLQGFLTEINGQRWNLPITAKQCSEETTSSVVEVMSENEVSGLGKPPEESTQLLSPEGGFSSREQVDGCPRTEVFPDYVTLNKDSVVLCPNGNKYIYKQVGEKEGPEVRDEHFQTGHSCIYASDTDFLNHAYFTVAEPADQFDCKVTAARRPGNPYTNFPCS